MQSVALRLVAERESEIEAFRAQKYWSVDAVLRTPQGAAFPARLSHVRTHSPDTLTWAWVGIGCTPPCSCSDPTPCRCLRIAGLCTLGV